MATTRWRDNVTSDINEAIALLIDAIADEDRDSVIAARENWVIRKEFGENKTVTLFNNEIEYNVVTFSFNKAINTGNDYTLTPQNGFLVAYQSGGIVKYIIDRNSDAKLLLRKMLSYTGKNEIDNNTVELSSDFFLWIINRVYYSNNTIELSETLDTEQSLRLESIKGFSGDTDDAQTKVTASGESVMNIISTLSFLLESSNFRKIIIELNYKNHDRIALALKSGTVEIETKSYIGAYDDDESYEKIAKLYLLCYIEILPILLQEYATDKENESWNNEKNVRFMKDVSRKIMERVELKQKEMDTGDIHAEETTEE